MKFAFIYALPGYTQEEIHVVETEHSTFIAAAIDFKAIADTPQLARRLVETYQIDMLELCGGLASSQTVAAVKAEIGDAIPVGAVYYGPEYRQPLATLVKAVKDKL